MSGGFFRGTSADQDTRFSDKQAKLLKSQKFAPELDHLVDMTKVKMDVIRPWIATRTTELLGFEDEVLIYFVYGLLEQKVVDGKKIQIQLTGFMEKNTGKFMRELWSLLLSAQQNASGVPQQFLDAKEEEMQRKKAETDRITLEIQKRKDRDGREREREKHNRMDVEADTSRFSNAIPDPVEKNASPRASSIHPEEVREVDKRPDLRTKKYSSSPQENNHSKSPVSRVHSPARSSSKSFSRSRSYSREGRKSRSLSVSSESPRRSRPLSRRTRSSKRQSVSPDMRYRSPRRRTISPRHRCPPHKTRSPARRRSPYARRRSNSRSRYRSPSPIRRRPSYAQRRSPPPLRHRSPIRGRSITPPRHRGQSPSTRRSPPRRSPNLRRSSPAMRHRSRTPLKRRSLQRRSPIKRLSPSRHRSPSSSRKLSPHRSPKYQRSSPLRSARQHESEHQIPVHQRDRSYSPYGSQSPPQRTHRSSSEDRSFQANGIKSTHSHHGSAFARLPETRSPIRSAREKDVSEPSDQRSRSLSVSPIHKREEKKPRHESPEAGGEEDHSDSFREDSHRESYTRNKKIKHLVVEVAHEKIPVDAACSADKLAASQSPSTSEKKGLERRTDGFTEMNRRDVSPSSEDKEYGPGKVGKERRSSYSKSNARLNRNYQVDTTDGASKEARHHNLEKRRHRKSHDRKGDTGDGSDSDSDLDDRKEAKRRKKDEKRQRKEERRRRREERHQRKLERRAAKLKAKPRDTVTPPSDFEKDHDVTRKAAENAPTSADFHSGEEGSDSDQRRLEIELRKKALESLRAKKATTH